MRETIEKIIIDSLTELNEELQDERLAAPDIKTELYGRNGTLDSLALVSFVTDVEELVSEEFDKDILLTDEKAMSATASPFRNVETLSNYIMKLLEK